MRRYFAPHELARAEPLVTSETHRAAALCRISALRHLPPVSQSAIVIQMDITQQIAHELAISAGAHLPAAAVARLLVEFRLTEDELLVKLLPIAASFSQCGVSSYSVGAAALGGSGAIYLGANLEFERCPLNQTIHAEQAAVVNAATHQERLLTKLAVSAPPCGYCRQFLAELVDWQRLQLVIPDHPTRPLPYYLPDAFGPDALGHRGEFLSHAPPDALADLQSRTTVASPDPMLAAATQAYKRAYAPYTHAPAAIAVRTTDSYVATGFSIENCAFNPSLSPLQVALANLARTHRFPRQIANALLIHSGNPSVDHRSACAALLERIAPDAILVEPLELFYDDL